MRGVAGLVCIVGVLGLQAQSKLEPHFSLQGSLGLPVALSNPVFETLTEVQGQFDLCAQMPLVDGLGFGAGVKGSWFSLEERSLSQTPTSGDVQRLAFYAKVQLERYIGGRTYYEVNGKVGSSTWDWNCR